jgi:hypothetical protein
MDYIHRLPSKSKIMHILEMLLQGECLRPILTPETVPPRSSNSICAQQSLGKHA